MYEMKQVSPIRQEGDQDWPHIRWFYSDCWDRTFNNIPLPAKAQNLIPYTQIYENVKMMSLDIRVVII